MGKEKADKFIRDLGATKPLLVESFAPSAERVSTGETPIAISLIRYTCDLQRERRAGGLCAARQNVEHGPVSGAQQQGDSRPTAARHSSIFSSATRA